MKFCITGGNGFIGVHLIHHILKLGHEVTGLIRPNASLAEFELVKGYYALEDHIYERLCWKQTTYANPIEIVEFFNDQDFILHFAGCISYSKKDQGLLMDVNAHLTTEIVNAALATNPKKLIYCSSIAAIAKTEQPFTENAHWDNELPHSFYGRTKHLGELEVWRAAAEGLSIAIINPGIVLGYGDWTKGSNSLFNNALKEFPFYSKGTTGFIGVEDVARSVISLCLSQIDNERFILVSENKTYHDVALMMAKDLDKKAPKFEVKGVLFKIILGLVKVKDFLNIRGLISTETTKAAVAQNTFSNSKILNALDTEFEPLAEVISHAVAMYKKSPPK